jgi:acyl-coenzyme A synthetase/AMP-(fatty) acid ligase
MKTTGTTQTNVMAMPTSTIFRIKTDAAALAAQLTSLVASAVGVRIEAVSNDEEVRVHVSLDEALHRRRRGWLLGEFDRQGCLARLLQCHLAETGASVGVESAPHADVLAIRLGSGADVADRVVRAMEDLVEWLALGRSDRLLRPWAGCKTPAHIPLFEPSDPEEVTDDGSAPHDVIVWLVDAIASPLEVARLDEALITFADDEARAAGAWIVSVLAPFETPAERLRIAGRHLSLRRWLVLGDDASMPPAGATSTHYRWVRRGATANGPGRFASAWIVRRVLALLANEGVQDVVVHGPGAAAAMPTPTSHAIVLNVLGTPSGRTRDEVDAGAYRISVALRLDDVPLSGPVSWPSGCPEPALLEALLLALDESSTVTGPALRNDAEFDELARRHRLVVAALLDDDGPWLRCHWDALRARRGDPLGVDTDPPGIVSQPALASCPAVPFNVCDRVFDAAHRRSAARLIDPVDGHSWCYEVLRETALAHVGRLRSLRLQPGDRVGFFAGQDGLDAAALMLACFAGAFVFTPLNPCASTAHCKAMLAAARPALVLGDERILEQWAVDLRPWRTCALLSFLDLPALAPREPLAVFADTPAVMLFTSGSTGQPKPVLHTHGDFATGSLNYGQHVLSLTASDCLYTPSRIFFAYGLHNLMLALQAGASVLLAGPLPADTSAGDVLERHAVSVFMAVPATLKLAITRARGPSRATSLRLCVSAGERLSMRLRRQAMRHFGVDVIDGIGSTETLSTFVSNRPGDPRAAGTGRVVPGFRVRLLNNQGLPCQVGEVGVMWVQGATLAQRYEGVDPSARSPFVDGWFDTQDLFFVDAEDCFHHVGRSGSVIKINACWFSPDTLEATLQTHPAVRECAVCVVNDEHGLPRPLACVVLDDETTRATAAWRDGLWSELRDLARRRLGKDHYPHFFVAVPALTRTTSGKLLRQPPANFQLPTNR